MKIPDVLVRAVEQGDVALVLGTGATRGAKNGKGEEPPSGPGLGRLILSRFLNEDYASEPLERIAELAISEADLVTVQEFVRQNLDGHTPAPFHLLLPTFRWYGLATTNFDFLIEETYQGQKRRVQSLVPIRGDKDRIDDLVRSPDDLVLLKLHGCLSITNDQDLPLILTPEQYVTHRRGRENLFRLLQEWGNQHPVVFVGHSLRDPDIRHLILELDQLGPKRPRFYLVTPELRPADERLWTGRRVTPLLGTYQEFLESLDQKLPSALRGVRSLVRTEHPIEKRFLSQRVNLTEATADYLRFEADYLHPAFAAEPCSAQQFYRGSGQGWGPILQDLDVRRKLEETILMDTILPEEADRETAVQLFAIRAEAGSGKSVLMRRVAWEAGVGYGKLVLLVNPQTGRLAFGPIQEISSLCQERVFLFVDNAANQVPDLISTIAKARSNDVPLTIITCERRNEWNVSCQDLDAYVDQSYDLNYLAQPEIEELVKKLEQSDSLGYLQPLSFEARVAAFAGYAGRQLLVALHEATMGRPFEDILVDEFSEVKPFDAQALYLAVCVLNRLRVPVRAGLISRVQGVPFEDFKARLFRPLEHVVQVAYDPVLKDYFYQARHPEIAEIVFQRILKTQDDRLSHYLRMLIALNISYKTDRQAYRRLVRGRTVQELFPDYQKAVKVFEAAQSIFAGDPYLFHQWGIYEMHRPNGNLGQAHDYLRKAQDLAGKDPSIIHSLAELARLRAERSSNQVEREFFLGEARKLAASIVGTEDGAYGFHTLIKISLDKLRGLLDSESASDAEVAEAVQQAERYLSSALQTFPGDAYLLTAEADFNKVLSNHQKVLVILGKAFHLNPSSPFVGSRFARALMAAGDTEQAIKILDQAVDANPGDRQLRYALAKALIDERPSEIDAILYHLKRGFTPGDQNHDAQFWYGRYLYEAARLEESLGIFATLRKVPLPYDLRKKIRSVLNENGSPKDFTGRVMRTESTYAFLRRDGPGDGIFTHADEVRCPMSDLNANLRVVFNIGFNFWGSVALNVRPTPATGNGLTP